MVMRRRRLEWFGHVKRRDETERIRTVAEMKMELKRHRGRPKLSWKDTVRRELAAGDTIDEYATDRYARPATPHREAVAKGEKVDTFIY